MAEERAEANIEMDGTNLWREETFTDRRIGTLQRLTPVTADGSPDDRRSVVFVGQTQVLTPGGALPLSFEVEASSLGEAIDKFGEHAQAALENAMQRLDEMRREAASSLIVPGSGGGAVGGPAGPGAVGGGGAGGIQIP